MGVWNELYKIKTVKFTQNGCASFKALYEKILVSPKFLGNFIGEAFSF
jgi:hypothetical protein